jgi:hypothetical protein
MKELDPRVLEIARTVRRWAEERAIDYGDTHPEDLACYCAIASAKFSVLLEKVGIKHRIGYAYASIGGHMFILVNNWIVDVTATQFSETEKILVRHAHATRLPWYHRVKQTFVSARTLIKWQQKNGWPDDQTIATHEWATT